MSRKQPSFGGVAALFGDDDENATAAPKSKKKQPSFGGVAGLFGDDEDGVGNVSNSAPAVKGNIKKKAAPSFGGVAAMFGDDTEKPPTQIITKPKKPAGRQASFGGVAALFGEDEEDGAGPAAPSGNRPHGKQASFGGVASLFGSDETANLGSKVINNSSTNSGPAAPPAQKGGSGGGRQQSFGGVASLFGSNDDDEEEQSAPASKNIGSLFETSKPEKPKPAATSTKTPAKTPAKAPAKQPAKKEKKIDASVANAETIGSLPKKPTKTKQRKGKRDPSVSGIASLFGDDDEDEQADLKSEKPDSGVKEVEIHKELNNQKEGFIKKQKEINNKLEREKIKQEDLQARIANLELKRDALVSSKKILAQMTAQEMERMRSIILSSYVPATPNATAATVS